MQILSSTDFYLCCLVLQQFFLFPKRSGHKTMRNDALDKLRNFLDPEFKFSQRLVGTSVQGLGVMYSFSFVFCPLCQSLSSGPACSQGNLFERLASMLSLFASRKTCISLRSHLLFCSHPLTTGKPVGQRPPLFLSKCSRTCRGNLRFSSKRGMHHHMGGWATPMRCFKVEALPC